MASTLVKTAPVVAGAGSSPTLTPTFATGTVAANLLILMFQGAQFGSTETVSVPAGWVQAGLMQIGTSTRAYIWYYPNNPGGITAVNVTRSISNHDVQASATMFEFSNAAGTLSFDVAGTSSDTGATTTTLTTTTSSAAAASNELAVALFDQNCLGGGTKLTLTPSATTGFTQGANYGNNIKQNAHASYEYKLDTGASAGATVSATETSSAAQGTSQAWAGVIATFAPPAAPSAGTKPSIVTAAVNRAATR